ncbi:MAG: CehA/McbA family metallohydrolase [Polyangiaceae bacterium]|nr:CehA/McbA family metallohydrolase [Polyangiaceae bacterium]
MRWKTRGALALLAAATAASAPSEPSAPGTSAPFPADAALLAGRLRVTGEPGDFAFANPSAVGVVRRSDGWLLDFWPVPPVLPSAPQLGDHTFIDGLWQLHPIVTTAGAMYNVVAETVRDADGAVEATSTLGLGAGRLEIVTRYALDATAPRIDITTTLRHKDGGRLSAIGVGDAVKWGNVSYYVGGVGRAGENFSGRARWIGRKGAGGDLVLSTRDPMSLKFTTLQHGLAPAIYTTYATGSLGPGESLVVTRSLAYSPIAESPAKPSSATGTLEVTVRDEAGKPLAAKLSLAGLAGTRTPDFGSDGGTDGAGRFVWSGTGRFARALPPGRYSVMATAGIERDAARWTVDIAAGAVARVEGTLPRVIETPGWISGDLHLHQAASVDADIAHAARVLSVAAEGVELAVATDHFTVTDLAPTVRALECKGELASHVLTLRGTELSPVGRRFGHFGYFPLEPGARIGFTDTTPKRMFAEARAANPRGLLTANHPRMADLGYFHFYKLDPATGRVPASSSDEYDPSFDAIEIFNGLDQVSVPRIRKVLFDWLHLLGQGRRYTATGNSDSHKLFFLDPGVPRNLIRWGDAASDADDVNADPAAVVAAIRAGRVTVTSGPIIDLEAGGAGPGEAISGRGPRVPVHLRIRAAPWIDVSEVEVLLGGEGRRVRFFAVPPSREVVRLDTTFELTFSGSTFVVVLARGKKPLENVFAPGVYPFAFTNPVWLSP